MEDWNPFGWLLLAGGFLFGVIVGGPQAGGRLWLLSGCRWRRATVADFWRDQHGATAAEYALLLGILATGMTISLFVLSDSIGGAMINIADTIIASGCDNQGQGTGFGGGQGGGGGQGAGNGAGNSC